MSVGFFVVAVCFVFFLSVFQKSTFLLNKHLFSQLSTFKAAEDSGSKNYIKFTIHIHIHIGSLFIYIPSSLFIYINKFMSQGKT